MTGIVRLAAVVGFLIAAGACTSEVASDPAPTLVTSLPTTTSTTSTTTTTILATTTTESTTTTSVPVGPVARSFPLLIGASEGGWSLLGSWQVDSWVEDAPAIGAPGGFVIEPGTEFNAGNLGARTTGAAGPSVEVCVDGRIGPTIAVTVDEPTPPGFGYGAVALPVPDWPLVPRPVAVASTGPETYRQLAVEVFEDDPVDASAGAIEQLVVTDLDGDGDDEALADFEFIQPGAGPGVPGDLSAVLLIDVATRVASTVRTAFVDGDLPEDEIPVTERSRVIDVADYNGDGVAEVAVHTWYFEGALVTVYEYDGTRLEPVLSAGCGI